MCHLATWFVAGLVEQLRTWRKPFNPLLGETWQARLSDGTRLDMEQVSHHPAVSAFVLTHPQGLVTFSGLSQLDVTFKGNGIKRRNAGRQAFLFADGTTVVAKYPPAYMRNLLYRCGAGGGRRRR